MTFNGRVTLIHNRDLGHGNLLATFAAPAIAAAVRPGQFVMLRVRDGSDPLLARPFSVACLGRDAEEGTLGLLYKTSGRGTSILGELRPGTTLAMVGPLGQPFPDLEPGRLALLVAGGIGVAPFPFLARRLASRGVPARLLLGARTATDLIGRELLEAEGVASLVATDDGSEGRHGFVSELLDEVLTAAPGAERQRTVAFVCGPTPMMAAVDAVLSRQRTPGYFSVESFMACGFGVCLSCVVRVHGEKGEDEGYRRICVDGPVFPAGRIGWPEPA